MTRVGIVGATGYAGAELVRILTGHPEVSLTVLTSRQYAGEPFEDIYPAMKGLISLSCELYDADRICNETDVVFLALPHKLPMAFVPELLGNGKKVIDLSADFRFSDPAKYEAVYQPHSSKDLFTQSVYGLSEVFRDQIKNTDLVGNPGCYPTCVALPLYPLLKSDLIDVSTIIADSKSGASGAGRSLSLTTHICEITESFKAYKVTGHRHKPEMDEVLTGAAGQPVDITFIPHLLPMSRGMETTIYAGLKKSVTPEQIYNCLSEFYSDCPFVRLYNHGIATDTANVRGTNFCDIGFVVEKNKNRIVIMSVIDNLVKGAAGQAVQNMNIMLGIDETVGLNAMPYPL
jgi:N-acetyl-gamma-glutamyl-phosphate reductase